MQIIALSYLVAIIDAFKIDIQMRSSMLPFNIVN